MLNDTIEVRNICAPRVFIPGIAQVGGDVATVGVGVKGAHFSGFKLMVSCAGMSLNLNEIFHNDKWHRNLI